MPRKPTGLATKKATDIANIQQQLLAEAESISENIGAPSTNNISTKGKVFTLPGGEVVDGNMQLVIVDFIASNKFYEGAYNEKDPQPPVCWALSKIVSELTPSGNAPEPQSDENCAVCPMNQWGSNNDGKACKNGFTLAVLPVDATPEDPIMTLNISPTAIAGFEGYVSNVSRIYKMPPIGVITTVGFHPEMDYPKLIFGKAEVNPEVVAFMSRREEATTMLRVEPEVRVEEPAPAKKKRAVRKKAARRRA